MTKRINAIKALTPSIKLQNTAQNELLCKYISRRSSLNAGEINNVLMQLQDAILFFTLAGHPVKLDGLGTFTPTIRLDGSYNLNVRIDRTLILEMNRHLKGWANYFEFGYPRKVLRDVNHYVRKCLIRHLCRRSQRRFRPPEGESLYKHLKRLGLVYL